MLRDEAVARMQQDLGFRSDRDTECVLRLIEAQADMERGKTLPRFLLLEAQTLALTAGVSTVSLPSNFLRRSNQVLRYTPSSTEISQTIPWKEWDAALQAYIDSDASGPKVAVLRSADIYFLPVPDAAYSVSWSYYKKDSTLETNIENLWLANAPYVLIGYAGRRMAQAMRNKDALSLFDDLYKTARATLFQEQIVQESEDDLILGANN